MPRSRRGRDVSGILLLDKPAGISSNQALQRARRLLDARKAGHTGSLDPLATGMLPLCFGEATKVSTFLLDAHKRYRTTAALGAATDTGDLDGAVIERASVPPRSADDVATVLARFTGEIEQVPPMYSALKHDGERLYRLARAGQVVERPPRRVTIHALHRLDAGGAIGPDAASLVLEVDCSKGTYIRTLVEDLAVALGTLGHVTSLRRVLVTPFDGTAMHRLPTLEALDACARDGLLLPVDRALVATPELLLAPGQAERLLQGVAVAVDQAESTGEVRLYSSEGEFVGLGHRDLTGLVVPRRMFPGLTPIATAGRDTQCP